MLTTVAPGSTIVDVRINDRAGLATDVSAARAIASSLRSLTIPNYPNLLVNAFGSAVCDVEPAGAGRRAAAGRHGSSRRGGRQVRSVQARRHVDRRLRRQRGQHSAALPRRLPVGAQRRRPRRHQGRRRQPVVEPVQDRTGRGVLEPRLDGRRLCDSASPLPTTHVSGVRFETGGDIIEGKAFRQRAPRSPRRRWPAYIAERMSTTRNTPHVSHVTILIAHGIAPLPQCGTQTVETGKAVVLSSLDASITDPPTATRHLLRPSADALSE